MELITTKIRLVLNAYNVPLDGYVPLQVLQDVPLVIIPIIIIAQNVQLVARNVLHLPAAKLAPQDT